MSYCVPIRNLKNTGEIAEEVNRHGVLTVTKNGENAFFCLSNSEYERVEMEQARTQLLERILLAEGEIEEGQWADLQSDTGRLKEKYGL